MFIELNNLKNNIWKRVFGSKKIFIYFIRLFFLQVISLLFLYDTTSYNTGIISIQSLVYCINHYLFIFFIILETIASILDLYGLDIGFITTVFKNISNSNFNFNVYILFEIKRYLFFLTLLLIINFLINKYKKKFKKYFNKKLVFIIFVLIPLISIIFLSFNSSSNKNLKIIKAQIHQYDTFLEKNNLLRNDNWFLNINNFYYYKKTYTKKNNSFIGFDKILLEKKYKNYYIIISESYPNFKHTKLENLLFQEIIKNNENLVYRKYQKEWDKSFTTMGAELDIFCGKNINKIKIFEYDLEDFFFKNDCIINKFKKNKELIFIHSYLKSFNNRYRYEKFFDQTYFYEELNNKKINECPWNDFGKCDHDILKNLNKIVKKVNKDKFVVFLTLNNHLGILKNVTNKKFIECKKNYPLNLNNDFCILFNNQFLFNIELNKFLKKINDDDIVILFGDTPPMFQKKNRIHFKDLVNIYVFNKK